MKTEFSVRYSIAILAILVLASAALSGNRNAVNAQNPSPPQAGQPPELPPPPLTAANMTLNATAFIICEPPCVLLTT